MFITANQLCDENVMKFWYGFEKGCQKSSFFLAFAHSDSRQYLEYFIFRKCYFFVLKFRSNLICVFLFWCITHCFLLSQLERYIHMNESAMLKLVLWKVHKLGEILVYTEIRNWTTPQILLQWVNTLVLEILYPPFGPFPPCIKDPLVILICVLEAFMRILTKVLKIGMEASE